MQFKKLILMVSSTQMLLSCASIGPHEVSMDMPAYGDVVIQAQSEQLLRNIVHQRYSEAPSLVKITSITSSYSLSTTLGAAPSWSQTTGSTALGSGTGITQSLGISPSVVYSDSPTISYIPVDDASIVTLLESPLTMDQISLLMNNGSDFMRFIASVGFLTIGDLDNMSGANTHIIETGTNVADDYNKFTQTIQHMVINGTAINNLVSYNKHLGIMTHFVDSAVYSPDALLIKKLLKVPAKFQDILFLAEPARIVEQNESNVFIMNRSADIYSDNLILFRMRSISSIINLLSHSVQVPDSDLKDGLAQYYKDTSGQPYNWNKYLNGIMVIYSSESEPQNAYVKTFMHRHWFYIKASDLDSKYTFNMLLKIMTLVLGLSTTAEPQTSPLITIPAGAPH